MRILLTFLAAIYICFNYEYSQTHKEIPIPILKENRNIDDLIERFLNTDKSQNVFLSGNSCITMSFSKGKNNYHYCVVAIDNKHLVNNHINYLSNSTENYGCFEFKGIEVFVSSADALNDCFSKTSLFRTFNYLYSSKSAIDPRDRYKVQLYKYENGVFNIEHSN